MGDTLVKHFHIIMAAFISGTVALFTSVLGVSGTIIGSVLSSFLYQLLSGYSEEKLEEGALRKPKLANEIVYIFPLVVIAIFELIFFLSAIHYRFDMIFDMLEAAVNNNLFRLMGLGLILLGAYPFFNSNNIDKRNGTFVLFIGALLFLRGLVDVSDITSKIFQTLFAEFDMLFALFVIIALVLVIFNILKGSDIEYFKSDEFKNSRSPRKPHARKIDTSFAKNASLDEGFNENSNHQHNYDSNHDHSNYLNDSHIQSPDNLPIYEEEVILVANPEDPNHPVRRRILKRVKPEDDFIAYDDYDDSYIIDEMEKH